MTSLLSRRPFTLVLFAAWACSSPGQGPELTSVVPSSAPNTASMEIRLVGNRLRPLVFADLDDPKSSTVSAVFAAELIGTPNVALQDVVWRNERELSATVPSGLTPGWRDLRVIDPAGNRTLLEHAFEVTGAGGGSAGGGTAGGGTSGGGTAGGGTAGGGTAGGGTAGGGTAGGGTAGGGRSMPPLPFFKATPPAVLLGSPITFDATGTTDDVTPFSQLEFSWDFPGDNPAPPPWTAWTTNPVAPHGFGMPGAHPTRLAVRDGHGNIAFGERRVRVMPAAAGADRCLVDTASMVDDGATACNGAPGPDGVLSLTEAVRLTNASPGVQVITFAMPYAMSGGPNLSFTDIAAVWAPVGTSLSGSTFQVAGGVTLNLFGLELTGQTARSVVLGSLNLEDCRFRNAVGLQVGGPGDANLRRISMSGCNGPCIVVDGPGAAAQVELSEFFGPPAVPGIDLRDCGASGLLLRSSVLAGLSTGVSINAACAGRVVVKNVTFHANNLGINFRGSMGDVLQNSIFTDHTLNSAACGAPQPPRQNNLIWQNAVNGCLMGTPNLLSADPLYFAPDAGDFRLHWSSPAVDTGIDAGADINGPAPGDWTGYAPDRGGRETW